MYMALSSTLASFGASPILPRRCKAFSNDMNKLIVIKSTAKIIVTKSSNFLSNSPTNKLMLPVGLYCKSRFSKSLHGQRKSNSIKACIQDESPGPGSVLVKISRFGSACYKLVRPYALLHILISAIGTFARVLIEDPQLFKWSLLFKSFLCLIAIMLGNASMHSTNDIYDVDIDRINKPYLPIPSGEVSLKEAWFSVIFDILAGLIILRLMNANLILISLYCLFLALGIFYSAPPFRFKRHSIATTIAYSLMGTLQDVGIIYAARTSLGLQFQWSPPMTLLVTVRILFAIVVGSTKDIVDVQGDTKYNVRTFAAIFGLRNLTFFNTGILMVYYIGTIIIAIYMPQTFKRAVMLPAHSISALGLFFQTRKLDKANYNKEAGTNFYKFVWMLFNLEYLLYPFI